MWRLASSEKLLVNFEFINFNGMAFNYFFFTVSLVTSRSRLDFKVKGDSTIISQLMLLGNINNLILTFVIS